MNEWMNNVLGLVIEDGGRQYQLWWTKDVGTRQIKMVSGCRPVRTKSHQNESHFRSNGTYVFVLTGFRSVGISFWRASVHKDIFKDILFQISRSVLLATCHQCAMILLETSALYKLFTYLLTYLHTYNMFNTFWRVMFFISFDYEKRNE